MSTEAADTPPRYELLGAIRAAERPGGVDPFDGADGDLPLDDRPRVHLLGDTFRGLTLRPSPTLTFEERQARARAMSLLAHMSVLFGVPVFLVELFTREDAHVLRHAKAAGAIWLAFYGLLLVSMLGHTWAFMLCLGLYAPALYAVRRAIHDRPPGLLGFEPLGRALFFFAQPKDDPLALPAPDAPTPRQIEACDTPSR